MRLAAYLFPRGAACLVCGRPSFGALLCEDCCEALAEARLPEEAWDDVFTADIRSAWPYAGIARKLVHLLKFDAVADAAEVLASGMIDALGTLPRTTVVTSVPMPLKRRRARGIDHGMELAVRVATGLACAYRPLLFRVGGARTQRGLSRARRLTNLQGTLMCDRLQGEDILLVDDVLTTGATAQACAQLLQQAGAGSVRVVTATRVHPAKRRKG